MSLKVNQLYQHVLGPSVVVGLIVGAVVVLVIAVVLVVDVDGLTVVVVVLVVVVCLQGNR